MLGMMIGPTLGATSASAGCTSLLASAGPETTQRHAMDVVGNSPERSEVVLPPSCFRGLGCESTRLRLYTVVFTQVISRRLTNLSLQMSQGFPCQRRRFDHAARGMATSDGDERSERGALEKNLLVVRAKKAFEEQDAMEQIANGSNKTCDSNAHSLSGCHHTLKAEEAHLDMARGAHLRSDRSRGCGEPGRVSGAAARIIEQEASR